MGTADPAAIRVEELARRAEVSVDTIRFYQKRQLLPPPRREGRIAWYGTDHVERLQRIKELQRQGFSLAVIRRLLAGELDAADAPPRRRGRRRAGRRRRPALARRARRREWACPAALLEAVAREGLLVPQQRDGADRYTRGRRRGAARRAAAARGRVPAPRPPRARAPPPRRDAGDRRRRGRDVRRARARTRSSRRDLTDDEKAERLVDAFRTLLPTVTTLVAQPLPQRAARGRAGAPRGGRRRRPSSPRRARSRAGSARSEHAGRSDTTARCPQGDAKRDAVESMFDRLAPRYDRMNRIISLGLDRRWRQRTVDALDVPRGPRVLDLACGTGDLCRRPRRARVHCRSASTSRPGCWPPRTSTRRSCAPTVRAPVRRRQLRRARVRLRAAQLRRPRRGVRRVRPRAPAAAGGSRRSTPPCRRTRSCASGNAVWFRGAVPLLGGCSPTTPRPTATSRSAPRTCPAAPELADRLARAGFGDVAPRTLTGGSVQLLTGTARVTATNAATAPARGHPRGRPGRPIRSTTSMPAASPGCTTAPASSPPASRRASPRRRRRRPRRGRRSTTRSGSPAPARSRSARCRSTPAPTASS